MKSKIGAVSRHHLDRRDPHGTEESCAESPVDAAIALLASNFYSEAPRFGPGAGTGKAQ